MVDQENRHNSIFPEFNSGISAKGHVKTLIKRGKRQIAENSILKMPYQKLAVSYRGIRNFLRPYKSARVYVRRGINRTEFFEILNARNVEYVFLRWWEDFPQIPPGEDMDILIRDEHRERINDLVTYINNGTEMKCDIYTVTGSNYGSHKGIPYFQSSLSYRLLEERILYRGVYVPSSRDYFASLAYHALFHKGKKSGLPGFGQFYNEAEHDYHAILQEQAKSLKIDVNVTARGIYAWLLENKFVPAEDTLSKLVEINPELVIFQKEIFSDIRGGEFTVFIVRDLMMKGGMLQEFEKFLEDSGFDVIDVRFLNSKEKENCTRAIRGGRWDKGPYKLSGGAPSAFVTVFDYHPKPLEASEQRKQSRMTNRNNIRAKYEFRDRINRMGKKNEYNGIHSSDNEHDAWFYTSLLGEDYTKTIMEEVEKRRNRYARRWNLVKTVAFDTYSKVEVIQFGKGQALKKTFRPNKNLYFSRELNGLKDLSGRYDFILSILQEGEGYFILPYYENMLDSLSEEEKERLVLSRKAELAEILHELESLGYEGLDLKPEKWIFTSDGAIFISDYSFLNKGMQIPSETTESPKNPTYQKVEYYKKISGN